MCTTSQTHVHGHRKFACKSDHWFFLTDMHSSVIGSYSPSANRSQEPPTWFSQPSVRTALHVPSEGGWCRCTSQGVFRNRTDGSLMIGDFYSAPPATTGLLSRVIEYTGNVIIGSGAFDMLIPTNGTLLVLQNVTWGGLQGFQERPAKPVRPILHRCNKKPLLTDFASSTHPIQSDQAQSQPQWQASLALGVVSAV